MAISIDLEKHVQPFDIPAGTEMAVVVHKPHRARVELVAVAPDGSWFTIGNARWLALVDDLVARNEAPEVITLPAPPDDAPPIRTREEWEKGCAAETARHRAAQEEMERERPMEPVMEGNDAVEYR